MDAEKSTTATKNPIPLTNSRKCPDLFFFCKNFVVQTMIMSNLTIETQPNFLSLEGALRSTDAIKLKPQLLQRIEASVTNYTIDITALNNIDITGLNSLLMAKKYSKDQGIDLTIIANEENPIHELVHLTKFGKFIDIQIA